MYRNPGLDMPVHGSLPASSSAMEAKSASGSRQVPGVTQPFMFSRLFLVTGILLAAIAVAGLISG